jgi:hypothetical protein
MPRLTMLMILRVYATSRSCIDSEKWNSTCQAYWPTNEWYDHFVYGLSARKLLRLTLWNSPELIEAKQYHDNAQQYRVDQSNQYRCTDVTQCKLETYQIPALQNIYITDIKGNDASTVLVNYVYGKSITAFLKTGSVTIKKSYFINLLKNKLFQ